MHDQIKMDDFFEIRMITPGENLDFDKIRVLTSQLAPDYTPPDNSTIMHILNTEHTKIFVAQVKSEPHAIVGVLLVCIIHLLTSTKIQIEDVVVDSNFRGLGIGKAMMKKAISYAKKIGSAKIDLTSTPDKKAANNLYVKLGFKKRNTNVYRLNL